VNIAEKVDQRKSFTLPGPRRDAACCHLNSRSVYIGSRLRSAAKERGGKGGRQMRGADCVSTDTAADEFYTAKGWKGGNLPGRL